jgi:hypothetical protein
MSGKRPAGSREHNYPDSATHIPERRTTAVRIHYPAGAQTPQDLQEIINGIRSISEAQRVIGFTATSAIVSRSSDDQARLIDWLVTELDRGAGAAAPRDYRWRDGAVRAAWLPRKLDAAAAAANVRQATGMQRVVGISRSRAVLMRGTPEQLAAAEPLLR